MKKVLMSIIIILLVIKVGGNLESSNSIYAKNIDLEERPNNISNLKYVALTFDDGPGDYTKDIIDILNKYDYSATFFMVGSKLNENYRDSLEYVVENNSEIGVHGYSHKFFTNLSKEKLEIEINNTRVLIEDLSGVYPRLVRPPYGSINNKIRNYGYGPYILWDIDTLDWKYKNSQKIENKVLENIGPGSIILMHEIHKTTVDSLDSILNELKEMNYEVVSVSKLAKYYNIELEDNKSYRNFK